MKVRFYRFNNMKKRIFLLALIPTLLALPVYGGGNRCDLGGGWYITPNPSEGGPILLNVVMTSRKTTSGSIVWSGFEPEFFGLCPTSINLSSAEGVFSRAGRRSFDYTLISFTTDEMLQAVCVIKSIGRIELDEGCNSARLQGRVDLYTPDQNPFGDDVPFFVSDKGAEYTMVRMTVEP